MADLENLARAFSEVLGARDQMTPDQYFRIAIELLARAPCRLLVFGAGRDTELYVRANEGGRTVVLEDQASWLDRVRHRGCTVVKVRYTTRLDVPPFEVCPLPEGLPPALLDESWDVIVVDGPEGHAPDRPGRQQSIHLAARLARPGTTVFLHDFERPAEARFAASYLRAADERHGKQRVLAVFRYPSRAAAPE